MCYGYGYLNYPYDIYVLLDRHLRIFHECRCLAQYLHSLQVAKAANWKSRITMCASTAALVSLPLPKTPVLTPIRVGFRILHGFVISLAVLTGLGSAL